ncbi:MAG: response regulator transcription factor [Pseudomonadota bacterium]|nr:response regulator transcription factor [Pseudomonadota bacterium]
MIAPGERRVLRAWRFRQALAACVLVLAVVPLTVLAAIAFAVSPDRFLSSPAVLVLPVTVFWIWLLGRAPARWLKAGADLRSEEVARVTGEAVPVVRRGIGLLAPLRHELRVGGDRFRIAPEQAEQIVPGRAVTVRYAPRSRAVLSIERQSRTEHRDGADEDYGLTRRERDLLRLIGRGLTDKEIARELNLSPSTVRTYNSDLYAKLGISRRTQAVPIAEKLGLTSED